MLQYSSAQKFSTPSRKKNQNGKHFSPLLSCSGIVITFLASSLLNFTARSFYFTLLYTRSQMYTHTSPLPTITPPPTFLPSHNSSHCTLPWFWLSVCQLGCLQWMNLMISWLRSFPCESRPYLPDKGLRRSVGISSFEMGYLNEEGNRTENYRFRNFYYSSTHSQFLTAQEEGTSSCTVGRCLRCAKIA